MSVPDNVKENIRAVLLSKTDGTGILVSQFLRDYKSYVQETLCIRDLGYDGIEKFLKDIPDVCRLEYSEKHMAYRLFGITKPNTFVSSFVKKAEGRDSDSESVSRRKKGNDRIVPPMNLDEKWEPNERGLYSLCFPNRKTNNGLNTRESVAMKFTQFGEVVDINIIPHMVFIRYHDEKAAKKAVQIFGEELNLRRADERPKTSDKRSSQRSSDESSNSYNGRQKHNNDRKNRSDETIKYNPGIHGNKNVDNDDDEWDEEYTPTVSHNKAPGSYPGKPEVKDSNKSPSEGYHSNTDDRKGNYGNRKNGRNKTKSHNDGLLAAPSVKASECYDVYVGNWPHEAGEAELKQLLQPFRYISYRMFQPKAKEKENNKKMYLFVDCETFEDTQIIINDLNGFILHNRTLQVRLGRKNPPSDSGTKNDISPKDRVEKDTTNFSGRKESNSRRKKAEEKMPPLESHRKADMPPLERIEAVALSPTMPELEGSQRRLHGMPQLENAHGHSGRMPELECSHSQQRKHGRLGGMPVLENSFMEPTGLSDYENTYGRQSMPSLDSMSNKPSPKLNMMNGGDVSSAKLNVGNFSYGTKQIELEQLFAPFGAKSVTIMNSEQTNRSTYAFVDFTNVQAATSAMLGLDQTLFKGRKLVVTYAASGPTVAQEEKLELPRHKETDISQLSPVSTSMHSTTSFETALDRSLAPNRGDFNFQRLTDTLHDYARIATRLRSPEHHQLIQGMSLKVMITHIENQKFFWGQILEDSENGPNLDLHSLTTICDELQSEAKVVNLEGLGRCIAKYENEWFRAWNTFETKKHGQLYGDLLFIDYGNRSFVPKNEIFVTKPNIWHLPPMARPFKLTDLKYDLEDFVNNVVVLKIVESGGPRNNYVNTVQSIQWIK
ncbi:hypothetical protein ACF0H5_013413 [Mactra antiquata]